MNLSGGIIGIVVAVLTYVCVGIPLVKSGMNFWLALIIQVTVMAAVVLLVLKLLEKYGKEKKKP